jgi:hypothetical protein
LASIQEITEFLKKFKHVLTQNFIVIPRSDYKTTCSYLGITISDVKNTISQLTYKDYMNGPEKDKGRPGNMVWEFGVRMQGEEIYIKLYIFRPFGTLRRYLSLRLDTALGHCFG